MNNFSNISSSTTYDTFLSGFNTTWYVATLQMWEAGRGESGRQWLHTEKPQNSNGLFRFITNGQRWKGIGPPLLPPFFRLSIIAIPTSAAGGEHCVKDGSEEWRLEALNSGAPSWGTSVFQTPVFSISGGRHPLLQERASQHLPKWCAKLPPSWTCTRPSSHSASLHFMDSHLWTAHRTLHPCWAPTGGTRGDTSTSKPPQTWTTSIWRSL